MPYPPALPPATRVNTTPSFDNHPADHNSIVSALAAIIAELGNNPSGASADLTVLLATMTPVGAVSAFAGAAVPTNWLMCDGTPVNRITYAALYGVLGGVASPYGQGDGVNTFNLPNLTGRFPMGGTALNTQGGTRDNSVPPHTHVIDHDHGAQATSGMVSGQSIDFSTNVSDGFDMNIAPAPGHTNAIYPALGNAPLDFITRPSAALTSDVGGTPVRTDARNIDHTHTVDLPAFAGGSGPASGAVAVNDMNLPPYIILRYIIKAL